MNHYREDPHDDSMTDAEFYKLMGIEPSVEANPNNRIEMEKKIPQPLSHQPSNSLPSNWLPITIFATLAILLLH